jgi:signal transduction histidine kinase
MGRLGIVPASACQRSPTTLWCLIGEAVANAVRHGRSQAVEVETEIGPDALALTIAGGGCGFLLQDEWTMWR